MKRLLCLVAAGVAAVTVAACGGHTAQEDAYLATLQRSGSQIELADPEGDLAKGHEVCDALKATKPEARYTMGGILMQQGRYSGAIVTAATQDLCPEYAGKLGG